MKGRLRCMHLRVFSRTQPSLVAPHPIAKILEGILREYFVAGWFCQGSASSVGGLWASGVLGAGHKMQEANWLALRPSHT